MKARQIVNGLGWSALATVINVVAQFAFMAILARLLEPATFGLMVMVNVALRFVSYFAQIGTTQTLIQRATITPQFTTAALVGALGAATVLYLGVCAAGPLFVWYFNAPELQHLLWTYGFSLILTSLGGPPIALLRRQGRFIEVNLIEVLSYLLGYGVTGVACALHGLGVWSLVIATLAQQGVMALAALLVSRYPLTWSLDRASLKCVFSTGSGYSVIGFLEFLWGNIESLFVGRWLGSTSLGVFNRAQMLANLPVEQAVGSVNKVMFPALSAMQQDRARLADGFLVLLLATGGISTMLSAGIAAAASDVVAVLLGSRWSESVPVVTALCLGVPAMFVYVICGITLDSLSELSLKLRLQVIALVAKALLVWALSTWGLTLVAVAVALAEVGRMLAGLWLMGRVLPLKKQAVGRILLVLVACGIVMYCVVSMAVSIGHLLQWPLLARLALDTATGMAAGLTLVVFAVHSGGAFSPLARFDALRLWHQRAYDMLFSRVTP